ncbi:MAG: pyridoxal-phosphate-dependent aminotransferase family protein [Candidatus Dormibacteraceae bacterium]
MSGRTFLQIPGPTNVPEPVLAALRQGTMNPRGPEFAAVVRDLTARLRPIFGTETGHTVISAGSGIGAVESAIVNTVGPGELLLCLESGFFGTVAAGLAGRLGARVETLHSPLGEPPDPGALGDRLRADRDHEVKAVLVVHNETGTGVTADLPAVRAAIDGAAHPALLLVDGVSSLASIEVRMEDWGLDVVAAGCQKGLMCPPGLAVLGVSAKAAAAAEQGGSPRGFFDWRPALAAEETGILPVTSPSPLFLALRAAVGLLEEEGLPEVYRRHARLSEGIRRAVAAWDLTTICRVERARSNSVTGVVLPAGVPAQGVVEAGKGLGVQVSGGLPPLHETTIRIGHMGSLNELEVLATVGGVELALHEVGAPLALGAGLQAAQEWFAQPADEAAQGTAAGMANGG